MLAAPTIENYLADLEAMEPIVDHVDTMAFAAAHAFGRMVDEVATVEDLAAYRTWMTYCRMRGDPEHTLVGAVNVAAQWAERLGVE